MDREALVEDLYDLWKLCEDTYKKKFPDEMGKDYSIIRIIFERADHHIISAEIERRRNQAREKKEEKKEGERRCIICGRPLTEGEIKFLDRHGGKDICYHCKQELQQEL